MSPESVAERLVADGVAADVAVAVARRRAPRRYVTEAGGNVAKYFDLASVTKPFLAVAAAGSGLALEARLGDVLPELRGANAAAATLELLLAHRAGLEAHANLFLPLVFGKAFDRAVALREAADAMRPGLVAGAEHPPVYSDLGYLLAGEMLARHLGVVDAGAAMRRRVLAPLGLERSVGAIRDLGSPLDVAPTEDVPFRGGVLRGVVHDENAWAFAGEGAAGHAGLFGTVGGVLAFGCAVLDAVLGDGDPFGDGRDLGWTIAPRAGGTLRAGWDGKSLVGYTSAGARLGPRSFGHLGFTGTSLWVDPDAGVVVTLLTNRVFPSRTHDAIRAARPWAHDALVNRALST